MQKRIVICNTTESQKFSFINDNILLKNEHNNIISQHSCHKIFSLWIIGNVSITSGVLERSKKFGFSIFFFSYNFKCYGNWASSTEGNFLLREKQYNNLHFDIAKTIVKNKILNQLEQLKSIRSKNFTQQRNIKALKQFILQAAEAPNISTLMGIEGIASKLYFEAWFYDMNWNGRKPRTKKDIINVLMDMGYTYLFNFVESMLLLYGFDIYKGILHQNFYQRKSLVCDIVEPFRVIIDRSIKNAFNLNQIKQDDFVQRQGQYILEYSKSKPYTQWLLQAILAEKEDIFLYVQSFYRHIIRNKPIEQFPQYQYKQ